MSHERAPFEKTDKVLLLFDGVCNLCNGFVQWIIRRDPHGEFQFAPLQSQAGQAAIARALGLPSGSALPPFPDSMVFIDEQGMHTRSDAAIRIARRLGFPYSLAAAGILVPRFIRNAVYDWVARNRFRWFGRKDTCMVPTDDIRSRFLEMND